MKNIIKQIIENSNHTNEKQVEQFIENESIEVYKNAEEYLDAGYDLDSEDYITLTDGEIVCFVGG